MIKHDRLFFKIAQLEIQISDFENQLFESGKSGNPTVHLKILIKELKHKRNDLLSQRERRDKLIKIENYE